MALPLTETDKFLLLHAIGAPESRDRVVALLDLAGTGNMTGPASATDNALVRFDGTTGALVQNSVALLSDAGLLTGLTGASSTYLEIGDGLVNAPGLRFQNDTDTGIFRSVNNVLSMSAGGVEIGQLSSTTSSFLSGTLVSRKDHNGQTMLQVRNENTGSSAFSRLAVSSDQGDVNLVASSGAGGDNVQLIADSAFGNGFQIGILGNNTLSLYTNSTQAISIDGSQLITLLGFTKPQGGIQGSQTDPLIIKASTAASDGLRIYQNSISGDVSIINPLNSDLYIGTNTSNTLRFFNSGGAAFSNHCVAEYFYATDTGYRFGNPSNGSAFYAIPNGIAVYTAGGEAVKFQQNDIIFSKAAGVEGSPGTDSMFRVRGNGTMTGTLNYGIYTDTIFADNSTTGCYGIASAIQIADSSFTTGFALAFSAGNIVPIGGTATITRAVGYYGSTQSQGVNNAWAADNVSFSGNWFINSTSTNPSLFSGQVRAASLGVDNSANATTLGTVVKKMEVFDKNGNSLGFVPIYDSIT